MSQFHFLSPCCKGKIHRYGNRRRQCAVCHRTWSIQQKKRGRRHLKINSQLAVNYLAKKTIAPELVKKRRLNLSMTAYLSHNAWNFPEPEPFIAIADGMWQLINGELFTVYVILLRPIKSNRACIMPPLVIKGNESGIGWKYAFNSLPSNLITQIKALVCDGNISLVYLGKSNNWVIQRCQFHLIASIKNYVTASRLSRDPSFGKIVLAKVHTAISTTDQSELSQSLQDIQVLIGLAKNKKLRSRLSGVIKHIDDFRAYQSYPHLYLPTTSNAAESLVQLLSDLLYRARGFRTIKSFEDWIKAVCMSKKTIICNGKNQQN